MCVLLLTLVSCYGIGVRQVEGFSFVQPSLDANKDAVSSLLLGAIICPKTLYHNGRPHVRSSTLVTWLTEYYRDCEVPNFEHNNDFIKQMAWLKSRDLIPLVDFKLPPTKKKQLNTGSGHKTKQVSHVADVRSKL
jgi:hypothetical protein